MSDRPRARYEDLFDLPEWLTGEILDGVIYTSRHPVPVSVAGGEIVDSLRPFRDRSGRGDPGGWQMLRRVELHFGDDVLVPDLVAWRVARMPQIPDAAFSELPPDWLCEILSPETARFDRIEKLSRYAEVGVGHVWLVDPLWRTLEVYRLQDGVYARIATYEGDVAARIEPFDALELDLTNWWLPEEPEPGSSS